MRACRSTSAILTAHGSAALTRTPTGCYASISRKAPISACTASRKLQQWPLLSTPSPERRSIGKRLQRRLTSCFYRSTKTVLRRPFESAQYASADYHKVMQSVGLQASMSRKADCYDNAPMESFFHTLKTELVHHRDYATRAEAKRDIFAYIEGFYNRTRRHSAIGYISPIEMELKAA